MKGGRKADIIFMNGDYFKKPIIHLILCGQFCLLSLTGCGKHNYKKEADEQVYNIIDRKWQDDFGSKANYKISDTEPLPGDIQIDKPVIPSGAMTLPDAVALATAHNREYQTQKEALYVKALDLRLSRHDFENQFFGGAGGGYDADSNSEVIGLEANVGFNRLLASGTQISTKVAAAWAEVLTGNLRSGLTSILSMTVTQPLLRGSDRRIILEDLTQAERNVLYQVRSFNRFRKTFVVSVIGQYYGVLQQLDYVKNAKENYSTLTWLYGRVEMLAKAGRLPLFELDRVRQDKLKALDIYAQAQKDYKQLLDEFKITLSLPTTADLQLDEKELEVIRTVEMTVPDFSEDEVLETALLRRLDLSNIADMVIDAQRKVFVAADALRAELNLVGSARAVSAHRSDRGTLGSFREEYGVGFELDLPLDRAPEQHVYRKALINLEQRQREYDQNADLVRLQVRQAHRDLTEAAERYRIYLEGLELARKRYDDTFLLLQYGRASSRRVLDAQNDLFDAQNSATEALVDYTIATLNFYRDTGVLHVRPDGMWQR
jgi:outer membrane protein TolC